MTCGYNNQNSDGARGFDLKPYYPDCKVWAYRGLATETLSEP